MWSGQRNSNWHLCSHISDHGENGKTISYTNVSSFLQSCHENHGSQRCSYTKRRNYLASSMTNIHDVTPTKQESFFLLKGQSKVPPKLQRATPPNMPLLSNIDHLLPLSPGIWRLYFLTLLSRSLLALSRDHLVLILIGWQPWLRVGISIFLVLLTNN